MPKVGKKRYPYTRQGKAAAKRALERARARLRRKKRKT